MLIHTSLASDRGFTLAELLVASMVTMVVLGGAVALTSQVQEGYRRQIENSAAEQEGRYALDWVSRLIRASGNNPYSVATTDCPTAATPFAAIVFDPDGDGVDDDIRLQTDSNPPDGLLGGPSGSCTQANEDVTVSLDHGANSITFLDNNLGGTATIRTDAVIEDLRFIYRDAARNITTNPLNVIYVETQVTIRTRTINAITGNPVTRVLSQEVRIRGRNY
ncbi:MAG: prepilin-type N-terminal cleavage/methylation domain-containing protein [Acidobacteriota bacterium]|nr:prepilin-type N-terminal cleavage/methylation domain-containing protein [Acidobacteriota bacterium]